MRISRSAALAACLLLAGLGLNGSNALADQARRKPVHHPAAAAPAAGPAPSRASDLNSPATDFSGVAPVLEDPKAELLKPRRKKDPNFD